MKSKGSLFLVPTPIGNLKDITLRALEVLQSVNLIGCEDTRKSRVLIDHYQIKTPLASYHKFNEKKRSSEFIKRLLDGDDIAIISDAGTPGISDPAQILVKLAIEHNITINALPGATAFVPAITASGFNSECFYFVGFLPEKNKNRYNILKRLSNCPDSMIFYVSPHDLDNFADDILKAWGDRRVCLARELSKIFEEYIRTSLAEIAENKSITRKGEFVAVIEGFIKKPLSDLEILEEIIKLKKLKLKDREIIAQLSKVLNSSQNRIKKLLYK